MTPAPDVKPLPQSQRKYLFVFLLLAFLFLLPALMFYATGYRFDFRDDTRNIVSTGGMYVSSLNPDVQIFVDEEPVRNLRVFRSASYIQNLEEGLHRLTVYGEGLQTWTKDIAVYPYIVTEAQSFNMPQVPQVRLITPYLTSGGASVVFVATTSEEVLGFASTTNPLFLATTTATSSFVENPEHEFIVSLFGTSTATGTSLVDRVVSEVDAAFNFATTRATTSTSTSATTTKRSRDVELFEKNGEVYARWVGQSNAIPYYYCVDYVSASTTVERYGQHVYDAVAPLLASSTSDSVFFQNDRLRVCRNEIRIDRKWQPVLDFNFFPNSVDLVLMLLEDGLYVVEVDDRAWQNTQQLYPGRGLRMQVDGGRIFIHDNKHYLEVFTERSEQ